MSNLKTHKISCFRDIFLSMYSPLFLSIFLLSACVSTEKTAVLDCGPWHFSIAQASTLNKQFSPTYEWAVREKEVCLKTVYAKGFDVFDSAIDNKSNHTNKDMSEINKPNNEFSVKLSQDKNTLKSSREFVEEHVDRRTNNKKYTVSNDRHTIEFNASSDWIISDSPTVLYQVFAKNPKARSAMFISSYDANPFFIWSDARDSMFWRIREELDFVESERKIIELKINQIDAFQVDYKGIDKYGAPLHFLSTQFLMGKKIVYLTTWSFEENYAENEKDFHQIVQSLKMKPKTIFGMFE